MDGGFKTYFLMMWMFAWILFLFGICSHKDLLAAVRRANLRVYSRLLFARAWCLRILGKLLRALANGFQAHADGSKSAASDTLPRRAAKRLVWNTLSYFLLMRPALLLLKQPVISVFIWVVVAGLLDEFLYRWRKRKRASVRAAGSETAAPSA